MEERKQAAVAARMRFAIWAAQTHQKNSVEHTPGAQNWR